MANGTTKRAPTGVVGAWKLLADLVGAAVTEAPSCDASMWSPLLQLVAVCCPDGCDEVSDTGKGLGPLRGSGLHTPRTAMSPEYGEPGSGQARSAARRSAPAQGSATAEDAPRRARQPVASSNSCDQPGRRGHAGAVPGQPG